MARGYRLGLAVIASLSIAFTPVAPFAHDAEASGPAHERGAPVVVPIGTDADDDGLPDALEPSVGTDPANPDTDGDGIRDGGDPDIIAAAVTALPAASLGRGAAGLRRAIFARLDGIQRQILAGRIDQAIVELGNLRLRLDGCPPQADHDDWIVACADQVRVRELLDLVRANRVTIGIDPAIPLPLPSLPGLDHGPSRPVAVAVAPDGTAEMFVEDEVQFHPADQAALATLLARYGGVVLRDDTPFLAQGVTPDPNLPASSGWYLVRVDPARSALDDLAANFERGGMRGNWTFSSASAARTAALIARETSLDLAPNFLADLAECTVCEHPIPGGNLDAATFWWMNEDDDLTKPGIQGLSIGVAHAWDYLRYQGYPPMATPYVPVTLAVVDSGFDLDPVTGVGNTDYAPNPPAQLDMVDHDWTAGGVGGGFSNCASGCWHGQLTFGVSLARPRNHFGIAGTSGGLAKPLLVRVEADLDTIARGVRNAVLSGADVSSISIAADCGYWCRHYGGGNEVKDAVELARLSNRIVVASGANQGKDISNDDYIPCKLNGVVCVGAIDRDGNAQSYSNWGSVVDIFAPAGMIAEMNPNSQPTYPFWDATNWEIFHGTSASAPFVAGVVALMKMLDHDLGYDSVRNLLWDTARPSTDPKVAPVGYIDAYAAVNAVTPNRYPTVAITSPMGNAVPYGAVQFRATVNDPEWSGPYANQFPVSVMFASSRDGVICTVSGVSTSLGCPELHSLTVGSHVISAAATDAFGVTATTRMTITVVNTPPLAKITYPPAGSTYFSSQQVNLRGFAFDPDGPIPPASLVWTSSIDGIVASGTNAWVNLSAGSHTITLTAADEMGAKGSDSIGLTIVAGAGYPTAKITKPATSPALVGFGDPITLEGVAVDPEDGPLPASAFSWSDSLDGPLGVGNPITVMLSGHRCSNISHTVTLTVRDSDGHQVSNSIEVSVLSLC